MNEDNMEKFQSRYYKLKSAEQDKDALIEVCHCPVSTHRPVVDSYSLTGLVEMPRSSQ